MLHVEFSEIRTNEHSVRADLDSNYMQGSELVMGTAQGLINLFYYWTPKEWKF